MRTRAAVGAAVVALLVGLGAWLAVRPREGDGPGAGSRARGGIEEPGLAARPAAPDSGPAAAPKPAALPADFDPRPLETRIDGTVTREGKPVAARVELRRTGDDDRRTPTSLDGAFDALRAAMERPPPSDVTDAGADGRFAFRRLAAGSHEVRAIAADGAAATVDVGVGEGAHESVDLRLEAMRETLHGRVVGGDGVPWEGDVVVWAEAPVATTRTDGDGRFTARGLPARAVVGIALGPSGAHVGPIVRPPFPAEYRIVRAEGWSPVSGRVSKAADRSPLSGAKVRASALDSRGPSAYEEATTGPDGSFDVLAPPEAHVGASAPGHVSAGAAVTRDRRAAIELLLPEEAAIGGRVVARPGGAPVAGATVRVHAVEDRGLAMWPSEARTDADGRFRVAGLVAGEYLVLATAAARMSAAYVPTETTARATARVALRGGATADVVIETVPAGSVVGTVVDGAGAGIEGARVYAGVSLDGLRGGSDPLDWSAYAPEVVHSGRGGAFRFTSLVAGTEYEVSARPAGHPPTPERRVVARADVEARVDLVVPASRWIEVTVVEDASGSPVADAEVHASTFEEPAEDGSRTLGSFSISTNTESGLTDARGKVRLGPLGPGTVSVSAEAEGFAEAQDRLGRGAASAGDLALTLRLRRGAGVEGRVLRPDGSPAGGAQVWLTTAVGAGHASGTGHRADADGAFRFTGLDGDEPRTVRAVIEEEGLSSVSLPVSPGDEPVTLQLVARAVFARVLDPDGRPVPRAKAGYSVTTRRSSWSRRGEVKDGRVVIGIDEEEDLGTLRGRLQVEAATAEDGTPLPLGIGDIDDVRPGVEVEVRLPRERTIDGRVVGPDGRGVEGARVRVERVDPEHTTQEAGLSAPWTWSVSEFVRTDGAGSFRVGRLGSGPHWVAVLPAEAWIAPPAERHPSGATGISFRLRPASAVTVTVTTEHAVPVAGARVVALRPGGPWPLRERMFEEHPWTWSVEGRTGADGRARLDGLDPTATYLFGVRALPSSGLEDDVVERWRPADISVRLRAGLGIAGVVLDEAGKPVAGVSVDCVDAGGVSRSTTSGEDGTFRFRGLAAGKARVEARYWGLGVRSERRWNAETTVAAGTEDVTLRLK